MTEIRRALAAGRARLDGTSAPQLESELLLAQALGRPRTWLHGWPETDLAPVEEERFEQLLARRIRGEPIAYILGRREFWSLEFEVTPDVLIPRPETEGLVEVALAHAGRTAAAPTRALDLGTGSGCVAVALAHERPDARITAVERSPEALALARRNAGHHGVDIEFVAGDWFEPLAGRTFDVIVSNPPYVAAGDAHLAGGDLRFEPRAALAAGPDGLAALRVLTAAAPTHLNPGGLLAVEHGHDQAEAVAGLFRDAGLEKIELHRDAAGLPRVTTGQRPR